MTGFNVSLALRIPCSWVHGKELKCGLCSPAPVQTSPYDNRPTYLRERLECANDLAAEYGL